MTAGDVSQFRGLTLGSGPDRAIAGPPWLSGIAKSRFAAPVMTLLSLLDACVSPILPEVLLVPLCLANPSRRWIYASWCAAASVVGAVLGYYIGFALWEAGLREFAYTYVPGFTAATFEATSQRFANHAFLWIVLAAFTPLPFKVFTVAAGVCHDQVSIETLVLASIAGRFPRFALEVLLIHRFGPGFLAAARRPLWRVTFVAISLSLLLVAVL